LVLNTLLVPAMLSAPPLTGLQPRRQPSGAVCVCVCATGSLWVGGVGCFKPRSVIGFKFKVGLDGAGGRGRSLKSVSCSRSLNLDYVSRGRDLEHKGIETPMCRCIYDSSGCVPLDRKWRAHLRRHVYTCSRSPDGCVAPLMYFISIEGSDDTIDGKNIRPLR